MALKKRPGGSSEPVLTKERPARLGRSPRTMTTSVRWGAVGEIAPPLSAGLVREAAGPAQAVRIRNASVRAGRVRSMCLSCAEAPEIETGLKFVYRTQFPGALRGILWPGWAGVFVERGEE